MKMSENNVLHTVPVVYHEVSDLNPTVQLLRSCGAGAALFFSWSRSRSNSAAPASPVGKLSKLVNY